MVPTPSGTLVIDRCIYYRLAQNGGSLLYDCVVDAKIDPTLDLAEVYLDPFDAPTLDIAQSLPAPDADLAVTSWRSWGQPGSRATAQSARILDLQPEKMILSGNYERSDSGSPVLDSKGRLVGLMIEASESAGRHHPRDCDTRDPVLLYLDQRDCFTRPKNAHSGTGKRRQGKGLESTEPPSSTQFGCVFLGKRSASATRRASDMPFGLTVLQRLLNSSTRNSLVGTALARRNGSHHSFGLPDHR